MPPPAAVPPDFLLALLLSTSAGASTGLGALLAVARTPLSARSLGVCQAAAGGFMLSVSLFDLLPAARLDLAPFATLVFFLAGALSFLLLRRLLPDPDLSHLPKAAGPAARTALWSGLLTAAGLALHNFPEGVAVAVASMRGMRFGLPLALAVALHNVPEGMAVALPLYFATGSRAYAVKMAFWSGMAEPAGVLFVMVFVRFIGEVSRRAVAASMSGVAGVMVGLSVVELAPQAVKHVGVGGAAAAATAGLIVMAAVMAAVHRLELGV